MEIVAHSSDLPSLRYAKTKYKLAQVQKKPSEAAVNKGKIRPFFISRSGKLQFQESVLFWGLTNVDGICNQNSNGFDGSGG